MANMRALVEFVWSDNESGRDVQIERTGRRAAGARKRGIASPESGRRGYFDAAKNRAGALADQIKAALTELGETLREEEGHVEQLIAERPITTMASAFALGVVIGFLLRRH